MAHTRSKWQRGDFFLLDGVIYQDATDQLSIRFRNGDCVQVPGVVLWKNRPGQPDWRRVQVDPETRGALLVPTVPGHPTIEGTTAEIPGDVVRLATDTDYQAYVDELCAKQAATR